MASIEVERNMPRLPRIINSGVDYSDLQRVLDRCNKNNEHWGKVWEEVAAMHKAIGDEALRDGRTITAGEAFQRASVCFHMAQATEHHDLPWKEDCSGASTPRSARRCRICGRRCRRFRCLTRARASPAICGCPRPRRGRCRA